MGFWVIWPLSVLIIGGKAGPDGGAQDPPGGSRQPRWLGLTWFVIKYTHNNKLLALAKKTCHHIVGLLANHS